ncbi:MAG: helix-hairpin-helix domain-containing protein, partial [Clostridium sp.]|uniref:helix-hairpin-helix domain-containing protein n=1 Tax=Clostridium sp. TaxID=1506 RepID=UPI003F2DD9F8
MAEIVGSINKIFFPKGKGRTLEEGVDFGISVFNILEVIDNKVSIDGEIIEDAKLKVGQSIKLKGKHPSIDLGQAYNICFETGEGSEKFGVTYNASLIRRNVNIHDKMSLNGFIKHVAGDKVGQVIIDTLDNPYDTLDKGDTETLKKIKGVGKSKAEKIIKKFNECKDNSKVFNALAPLGCSVSLINKIIDAYNNDSDLIMKVVYNRPYELYERIKGVGFKKADELAMKVGYVKADSPLRIEKAINYVLEENGENGRSYIKYEQLLPDLNNLIGYINYDLYVQVCKDMMANDKIVLTNNNTEVGSLKYYNLEKSIFKELMRIANGEDEGINNYFKSIDVQAIINKTEEQQGFKFNKEQREAIEDFGSNKTNIFALTG